MPSPNPMTPSVRYLCISNWFFRKSSATYSYCWSCSSPRGKIEDVVAKLIRIRHYAAERSVDVPGFWSRPAENLNESTLESRVAFCGAVRGNSMCVGPSGNIYGCGYSTTQLGTLSEIQSFHAPGTTYHRFVRNHLTGAMKMCKGCIIEGQCGGGCNITQEFARATKTAKLERMCDFYRRMTQKILREQLRGVTASESEPKLLRTATERR